MAAALWARCRGPPAGLRLLWALCVARCLGPCGAVGIPRSASGIRYPGEKGYWVKLKNIHVLGDSTHLDPSFDEDGSSFVATVQDTAVSEILLGLELNIPKYDLMYTPAIFVDGKRWEYDPNEPIEIPIALNETLLAPVDRQITIRVQDPTTLGNWLVGEGAHDYYVQVLQAPPFKQVVEVQSVVVKSKEHEVQGSPRFAPCAGGDCRFVYALDEDAESVDLQVGCTDYATRLTFDGVDAALSSWKTVPLSGAATTIVAQCIYDDHRWTNTTVEQSVILTFSRESKLTTDRLQFMVMPQDGYCVANRGPAAVRKPWRRLRSSPPEPTLTRRLAAQDQWETIENKVCAKQKWLGQNMTLAACEQKALNSPFCIRPTIAVFGEHQNNCYCATEQGCVRYDYPDTDLFIQKDGTTASVGTWSTMPASTTAAGQAALAQTTFTTTAVMPPPKVPLSELLQAGAKTWWVGDECFTGHVEEPDCIGEANGFALGDGSWCWDGFRDTHCSQEQIDRSGHQVKTWWYQGACFTGHTKDSRCEGKQNGTPLPEGGWCWDGLHDNHCTKAEMGDSIKKSKPPPDHEKVWWFKGVCFTGGYTDPRCQGRANGFFLKDGSWCWDGNRDMHCPPNLAVEFPDPWTTTTVVTVAPPTTVTTGLTTSTMASTTGLPKTTWRPLTLTTELRTTTTLSVKVWWYQGVCFTGGYYDPRCEDRSNGQFFEDGSWCWDGKRDMHCSPDLAVKFPDPWTTSTQTAVSSSAPATTTALPTTTAAVLPTTTAAVLPTTTGPVVTIAAATTAAATTTSTVTVTETATLTATWTETITATATETTTTVTETTTTIPGTTTTATGTTTTATGTTTTATTTTATSTTVTVTTTTATTTTTSITATTTIPTTTTGTATASPVWWSDGRCYHSRAMPDDHRCDVAEDGKELSAETWCWKGLPTAACSSQEVQESGRSEHEKRIFWFKKKCYTMVPDVRCKGKKNGLELLDHSWCFDSERNAYCTAEETWRKEPAIACEERHFLTKGVSLAECQEAALENPDCQSPLLVMWGDGDDNGKECYCGEPVCTKAASTMDLYVSLEPVALQGLMQWRDGQCFIGHAAPVCADKLDGHQLNDGSACFQGRREFRCEQSSAWMEREGKNCASGMASVGKLELKDQCRDRVLRTATCVEPKTFSYSSELGDCQCAESDCLEVPKEGVNMYILQVPHFAGEEPLAAERSMLLPVQQRSMLSERVMTVLESPVVSFSCFSRRDTPEFMVITGNARENAHLLSAQGDDFKLLSGLPTPIRQPPNGGEFTLRISAGSAYTEYPVLLVRPALCLSLTCPYGKTGRPQMETQDVREIMCKGDPCNELDDVDHCCVDRKTCEEYTLPCFAGGSINTSASGEFCQGAKCMEHDAMTCCTWPKEPELDRVELELIFRNLDAAKAIQDESIHQAIRDAVRYSILMATGEDSLISKDNVAVSLLYNSTARVIVFIPQAASSSTEIAELTARILGLGPQVGGSIEDMVQAINGIEKVSKGTITVHAGAALASNPAVFKVKRDRGEGWYYGTVTSVNTNGTYTVNFDYGNQEANVPLSNVVRVGRYNGIVPVVSNHITCDKCEDQGHQMDSCDCGYCGSWGNCYESCGKDPNVPTHGQACIRVNPDSAGQPGHKPLPDWARLRVGDRVEAKPGWSRKDSGRLDYKTLSQIKVFQQIGCSPVPSATCGKMAYEMPDMPPTIAWKYAENRHQLCFYDETCSDSPPGHYGLGCNAGGNHLNCRFCGFGVYEPCPYAHDCSDLDSHNWPEERKDWCCEHYNLGCKYDCHTNESLSMQDLWEPDQVMWCCEHAGLGCPYDCSNPPPRNKLRLWSREKRQFCCQRNSSLETCDDLGYYPGPAVMGASSQQGPLLVGRTGLLTAALLSLVAGAAVAAAVASKRLKSRRSFVPDATYEGLLGAAEASRISRTTPSAAVAMQGRPGAHVWISAEDTALLE